MCENIYGTALVKRREYSRATRAVAACGPRVTQFIFLHSRVTCDHLTL